MPDDRTERERELYRQMRVQSARAVDADRRRCEAREMEAAALRLAHAAGFTEDEVRAQRAHDLAAWARAEDERDRLEQIRVRMVEFWSALVRPADSDEVFTRTEIAEALQRTLEGHSARLGVARRVRPERIAPEAALPRLPQPALVPVAPRVVDLEPAAGLL